MAEETVLLSASLSHWTLLGNRFENCDVLLQMSLRLGPELQDSSGLCVSTPRDVQDVDWCRRATAGSVPNSWTAQAVNDLPPVGSFITDPLLCFEEPDWQSDSNNFSTTFAEKCMIVSCVIMELLTGTFVLLLIDFNYELVNPVYLFIFCCHQ